MRFAIYYAPDPTSLMHELGSRWLGRDAFNGEALAQPFAADLAEFTSEPRRYGFHATLKPPFALKDEWSPAALEAAVEVLADTLRPFEIATWDSGRWMAFWPLFPPRPLRHSPIWRQGASSTSMFSGSLQRKANWQDGGRQGFRNARTNSSSTGVIHTCSRNSVFTSRCRAVSQNPRCSNWRPWRKSSLHHCLAAQ